MSNYSNRLIKIAVIGDIHDRWEETDNLALQHLKVDLVLFVGDFGNESVEVVRRIASLEIPKAAIMGNHDAWYTASAWGRRQCPYDHEKEDWVQQQLDLLGEAHVGYGKLDFPQLNLSVVGSRPFSWGGSEWKNKEFLRDRYGVTNFQESTTKIVAAASQTACDTVIFLGHNGPFGLGDKPEDICGRDWEPLGGDYGDPDFAEAIDIVRATGKWIPLVTFGHMHHLLRHTRSRLRTAVTTSPKGTVYLNAASVPRIIRQAGETCRNFSLVTLQNGIVAEISLVWVGEELTIVSNHLLYRDRDSVLQPI
ncbi:TIGR04168 family protein [Hydrococcus rivularis NIES-593]|uniref:TIGR04168 family protein n=1 Tax=Hydrococcus rivularis NIES-593 TaxID=1921803 RepID=A0A1U7H8A8_9CYAN|nr:TIGR04168 family protein [Hydrococcus rivularis]OKH19129.1 TIGR04168 family protein [Hydrococcus rivularis NIES-593]